MTFEEKKYAVLTVHKNKITHLSGPSYGDKEYFSTSAPNATGRSSRTIKFRTEEKLFDTLYELYFHTDMPVPKKNKTYNLQDICHIFGFREDHAQFLMGRKKENRDILNQNKISHGDILYLIAHGCQSTGTGDLQKMQNVFSEAYPQTDHAEKQLKQVLAENKAMKKQLQSIQSILDNKMPQPDRNSFEKKQPTIKKGWKCTKNDPNLPPLTPDETEWTDHARHAVYEVARKQNCQYAAIIRRVYNDMAKREGVNWEEITKQTLDAFEMTFDTDITKLRVVAYNGWMRTLFDKVLDRIDTEPSP